MNAMVKDVFRSLSQNKLPESDQIFPEDQIGR